MNMRSRNYSGESVLSSNISSPASTTRVDIVQQVVEKLLYRQHASRSTLYTPRIIRDRIWALCKY